MCLGLQSCFLDIQVVFILGLKKEFMIFHVCAEFINLVSSESNDVCSREEKRTIAPEHVLKALEVFNYLNIQLLCLNLHACSMCCFAF